MTLTDAIIEVMHRRGFVNAPGPCDPFPPPDPPANATPDQLEQAAECYVSFLECCLSCPDGDQACCTGCAIEFWKCWEGVFPGSGPPSGGCGCGN